MKRIIAWKLTDKAEKYGSRNSNLDYFMGSLFVRCKSKREIKKKLHNFLPERVIKSYLKDWKRIVLKQKDPRKVMFSGCWVDECKSMEE